MGAICSKRSTVDSFPDSNSFDMNMHGHVALPQLLGVGFQLTGFPSNLPGNITSPMNIENMEKELQEQNSFSYQEMLVYENMHHRNAQGEPEQLSRVPSSKSNTAKSKSTAVAKIGVTKV